MKSRVFTRTLLLAAVCAVSLALSEGLSLAVSFPIIYEGTVHVTASYSAGTCEGDAKMKITLYAGGTLTETTDAVISMPGPNRTACEIASLDSMGQPWRVHQGTHDKASSFSVNISYVPVSGSFSDAMISGTGTASDGFMTETYTFTLYAAGAGSAPTITLEPADYPAFQANVLIGEGFTVRIRKEDGLKDGQGNWKLNWSTLLFATDGLDNSLNFINTAANQGLISVSSDNKEVSFHVRPDPKKFMNEHNVFNIKFNGDHLLGFRVCDTGGRCGESQYTVYFGPLILTGDKTAERCGLGSYLGTYKHAFDIEWIAYANVGHWSTGDLYALIQNSIGAVQFFEDGGLYSNYAAYYRSNNLPVSIGYTCPGVALMTGEICIKDYQTYRFEVDSDFVTGPLTFFAAFWDKPNNTLKYDVTTFDLCK